MKTIHLLGLLLALSLASCGDQSSQKGGAALPSEAKGGKAYGGVFNLNESEYIKTLYPLGINDVYSLRVAAQVFEGLFKFNQDDLSVVNALAESYETDSSGTIYTIRLRKGVYFQDADCFAGGKGREVKAEDVRYCFTRACTQSSSNQGFSIFEGVLKGADAYYKASTGGKEPGFALEGIKVIDDYTIQLELNAPSSILLYQLARPFGFIYPKEAVEKYGEDIRLKPVGFGAFYVANIDNGNSIILKRHPNYYGRDEHGNQLPFLEAIKISFIPSKKTELLEFKKGKLDMVYRLPSDQIIEIAEEAAKQGDGEIKAFELQRTPEMTTQFLAFMNQQEVFKDVNVRKAFSFAIDRQKILDFVLNGEGEAAGINGLIPPVFKDYDISQVRGYELRIDSAKYYLSKAGFPNGQGFPEVSLDVNAEGDRQVNVAQEIQKQLKDHLNVNVRINVLPFAQLLENSFQGRFMLARNAYYADYPNPENFLWLFLGQHVPKSLSEKSIPNIARFSNARYDSYYRKGLNAKSQEEAFRYFRAAEQVLLDEAGILVLWYDEAYRLIKPYVRNFPNNAMQFRDFSVVYFVDKK